MSFISAIIIVGLYFNRKRAIATGIAMSGSGLGTFAYAYLTDYLILQFDWRGTILILAGILLNGVVCGALFRPLGDNKDNKSGSTESLPTTNEVSEPEELKNLISEKKFNAFLDRHDLSPLHPENSPARLTMSTDIVKIQKSLAPSVFCDAREFSSQRDFRDVRHRPIRNQMSKRDIFYSGSLTHLHARAGSNSKIMSSRILDNEMHPSSQIEDERQCSTGGVLEVVKSNCALFKDKIFVLLLLTNVCWTGNEVFMFSLFIKTRSFKVAPQA